MSGGDISNLVPSSCSEASEIEKASVNSTPSLISPLVTSGPKPELLQQPSDDVGSYSQQKDSLEENEKQSDILNPLQKSSDNEQSQKLDDTEQLIQFVDKEQQLEKSCEKKQQLEKSCEKEQQLEKSLEKEQELERIRELKQSDSKKGNLEQQSDAEEKLKQQSHVEEKLERQSDIEEKLQQQSDIEEKLEQPNDEEKLELSNDKEEKWEQSNDKKEKLEQPDDKEKVEQPTNKEPQLDSGSQQVEMCDEANDSSDKEQQPSIDEVQYSNDAELRKSDDVEEMDCSDNIKQNIDEVEQIPPINTTEEVQHSDNAEQVDQSDGTEQTQPSNYVEQMQQSEDDLEPQIQHSDDIEQQMQISDDNEPQMQHSDDMEQKMQQSDDMEPHLQQTDSIQQSDDLSFDLISRQKLSLTPQSIGFNNQEQLSPKGPSGVQVFEEDTRSSWSIESTKTTPIKEPLIDETSQNSVESQKSGLKRRYSDDEPDVITFPPENVFEYMWPLEKGEFYFLQEQISDYLSVKSFKRKYPDLQRRVVDIDEKDFLRERGVVTETQCDLGLTALRSDDVLELMSRDYPEKYKNYIQVLREKEKQNMTEKQKEHISTVSDKNKMAECLRKAIKSASEYNSHLNQERREERRSCYDLQTFTIHYPVGTNKVRYVAPKMGKYPVALLPGQFQDSYKKYTPEELKYLPLNTVLYGPLQELKNIQALSDGSHSDSEDSSASDGSCSSSQGTHDDGSGDSTSGSEKNIKSPSANGVLVEKGVSKIQTPYKPKDKPNAMCKICKLGCGTGKDERNEPFIHCSQCEKSGHPTCLQVSLAVVDVLKTYPWQCMDCKSCSHCRAQNNKDKMLFCDNCDRGYHMFCIGLKNIPQSKWICQLCGYCAICGATKAGPDLIKSQWQYDIHTPAEQALSVTRRPKIVCQTCFKRKR